MDFLPDDQKNTFLSEALSRQRVIDLDGIAVTIALFHQRTSTPNEATAFHTHEYHEYSFVRSGSICYEIEGERCERKPVETIFIPAGKRHRWMTGPIPVVLDGFMLSIAAPPPYRSFVASISALAKESHYRMRSPAAVLPEIDREIEGNAPYARRRVHALVTDMIYWLFRENFTRALGASAAAPPSVSSRREMALYTKALAFISAHISEPITPARVASELGFSARYINRIFNRFAGMSSGEYMREMKLGRSFVALSGTSRASIAEVAASIGMRDVSYFTRLFHKRYGMSPRDMRDAV
ncbi:MAG: AraC family transcriptional regulator [Spirochaetota bacterium]